MPEEMLKKLIVILQWALWLLVTAFISGCGTHSNSAQAHHGNQGAYVVDPEAVEDLHEAARYAPVFLVNDQHEEFNHIGTPASLGSDDVFVDSSTPTVFVSQQDFSTPNGDYQNFIYRVHFEKVPYPHLTAGKNGGLLVVLTYNQLGEPVLITTVHTCGCYLAFLPTTHLDPAAYPHDWTIDTQDVFGVRLPGLLDLQAFPESTTQLQVVVQGGNHRVIDIRVASEKEQYPLRKMALRPMDDLLAIPHGNSVTAFFETHGSRKGYVKNSQKWLERILMSWWALDFHIGEDKALGPEESTGVVFYTSLKPWAREDSNMWYFADFLRYWGWNF